MDSTTYHKLTSYNRFHMTPHHLDWDHVPLLQKAYPALPTRALNPPQTLPDGSLKAVLDDHLAGDALRSALGFQDLSAILMLANGITAQRRYPSQTQFYRSSPSAGALYPNEIYVAAQDVADLPSGLYNYQVMDGSLVELGKGRIGQQVANTLTRGIGSIPAASLLITGIFFRSAWKYRARAFRYVLLDAGHLIENLVLAARAHGYMLSVHYDFDDIALERLLGIDPKREACLAVVNLYAAGGAEPSTQAGTCKDPLVMSEEMVNASRISTAEVHYEAIQEVRAAGNTVQQEKTVNTQTFPVVGGTPGEWFSVRTEAALKAEQRFVESVLKRRSRRNFVPVPMPTSQAMHLMQSLCMNPGHENDEGLAKGRCMTPGFAAVNIEAFDPGIYLLDTQQKAYGLISGGSSGGDVARVCLVQAWLKNGSLHFLFMANLPLIDARYGARGYRYAMLNSGRAGQRIYLAANSLGLGACGIGAIYDDEARQMLSLNDESALLYLVAVSITKSEFGMRNAES